ncbi:feruloyl-CoA synthase [Nitratireductor arenosus]|nr:feruloyl-CoA synthase [Nitratireductor arenosus]
MSALFAEPRVHMTRRDDGSMILSSPVALPKPARCVGAWLVRWARDVPERIFLAERGDSSAAWRTIGYGETLNRARAIAAFLLKRGLSPERPVAILSDNAIDHALLALGAMHAGIPVATVSPAYSLMSQDHGKLRAMIDLVRPGLVYVSDETLFSAALAAIADHHDGLVVTSRCAEAGAATDFDTLLAESDDAAVGAAFAAVGPDTTARYLFTSGSTGAPKAVINTHRMLTSSQEAKALTWPFLASEPPVIVDWLPWSHTFGANHNFNLVLRNGGTLYIDAGKPAPHLFHHTVANLKDVGPDICFNVPRGFDMLIGALREDADLRRRFFTRTKVIFYAGAALPQNLWAALETMARETTGAPVPMVSSWGSTETAPLATDCHFQAERSGNIGIPVPGTELKLVPAGDKLEIRVRGPNVTPGYLKNDELTRAAFDEEGFYRIGDAVRLADPDRPERGLFFDGRVAEDFKLMSGTWVSVGDLRVQGIAALDPVAQDIVVTGHDREEVGFLVFPNIAACRKLAGLGDDAPLGAVLDHQQVRARVRDGLVKLKTLGGGSSRHATRARLLEAMPAVDAGEITDKGYINQRAVLARRANEVERLHGDEPADFIGLE